MISNRAQRAAPRIESPGHEMGGIQNHEAQHVRPEVIADTSVLTQTKSFVLAKTLKSFELARTLNPCR